MYDSSEDFAGWVTDHVFFFDDEDGGEAAFHQAMAAELTSDRDRVADEPPGVDLMILLERLVERRGELDGYDLVEAIGAARRQINQLEALCLTLTNELAYCPGQGYPLEDLLEAGPRVPAGAPRLPQRHSMAAGAIEAHLGWGRAWARAYDSLSYALAEQFTATRTMLERGQIEFSVAKTIADRLCLLSDPGLRGDAEAMVLAWLKGMRAAGRRINARTVGDRVDEILIELDPDAAGKRHREKVRRRSVQLIPNVDSVADLAICDLPGDVAADIYARLDAIARTLKRHGDKRGIGQLRADIAVSLLLGESGYADPDTAQSDTGHNQKTEETAEPNDTSVPVKVPVKAKITLHVSLTELLGLYETGKTDPAVLGGYGPVISEVAERVLDNHLDNPDAEYALVVTHPRTGKPLQLHPVNARLFRGRRQDVVNERWHRCTWPTGCRHPAEACATDHSRDHAFGGTTSEDNGGPVCPAHHWEKTKNGWRHERERVDLITWVSPFGHSYPVLAPAYTESEPSPRSDPVPEPQEPEKTPSKANGPPPF